MEVNQALLRIDEAAFKHTQPRLSSKIEVEIASNRKFQLEASGHFEYGEVE